MKLELAKREVIHFIGIGGIGYERITLIMKSRGFNIQGSDVLFNKNIERQKRKIKIFIGHKKTKFKKVSIIVISSAIKNNPELVAAKKGFANL